MIPNIEVLLSIVKGWKKVIIWFDNDAQGIKSSQVIADLINSYYPNKATALWLPEHLNPIGISDPSDLYYRKGQQELQSFLKRIIIHT